METGGRVNPFSLMSGLYLEPSLLVWLPLTASEKEITRQKPSSSLGNHHFPKLV